MKALYLVGFLTMFFSCKNDDKKTETVTAVKGTEAYSKTLEMLQGTWVNTQDTLSTISFSGNTSKNSYKGLDTGRNIIFTIDSHCVAQQSVTPSEKDKYINTGGDATECYYIETLTENNLALKLMAQDITLQFKRQ